MVVHFCALPLVLGVVVGAFSMYLCRGVLAPHQRGLVISIDALTPMASLWLVLLCIAGGCLSSASAKLCCANAYYRDADTYYTHTYYT